MFLLVIGGSGSGKSAYAEECACAVSEKGRLYYLAAMQACDEESVRRIERHRRLRSGKGFWTIEQPVGIEKALAQMTEDHTDGIEGKRRATALLECVSNLTANEMFAKEGIRTCEETTERVVRGVMELGEQLENLIVVTNNVAEDGVPYDETTRAYLEALGAINENLAGMADRVVEVVSGIPVVLKEGGRMR